MARAIDSASVRPSKVIPTAIGIVCRKVSIDRSGCDSGGRAAGNGPSVGMAAACSPINRGSAAAKRLATTIATII